MAKRTDYPHIQKLLTDYVSNVIVPADYQELMDYIERSKEDRELYHFMDQVWNSRPVTKSFTTLQSGLLYKNIINDPRFSAPPVQKSVPFYKNWYNIAAAAMLFICLSAGLLFFNKYAPDHQTQADNLVKNNIGPGSNKATLTLEDGRKIILTDAINGNLAIQAGVNISKTADGQLVYKISDQENKKLSYNSIETPRGGQYQVNLPDGTRVWMNSASVLKFPTSFAAQPNRRVELTGEAYFEVAHDPKHPFKVKTAQQEVEVLGTHFNINSYTDEASTRTTLLQGRVKVNSTILKPGQESVLTSTSILVKPADIETTMAWKNGYFIFKNEDLPGIMRKISRWYDVEIVYPESLAGKHFEGSISRFKNVAEVLRKFELTGNIHFKIEGRRITAMP